MGKRLYCPSCGVDVESFVLVRGGDELSHCAICGLVLDDGPPKDQASAALPCVLIAEDTISIRDAVAATLKSDRIALEIGCAANGVEFISQASTRLKQGKPLSLAILDVEMPIMNGVQAARSLREVEKQLGAAKPTPILFFTSRKIDDRFKQVLQQLQPSSFVNKGTSTHPGELAQRIRKVLAVLLPGKVPSP